MKPIKNLIWMREKRGKEEEEEKKWGVRGGRWWETHNLPLPPFLPHTLRQKQIHPSGGCPHRDSADTHAHTHPLASGAMFAVRSSSRL